MSALAFFGLFCLLLIGFAAFGFGLFITNEISKYKMDDATVGWMAYMLMSLIIAFLASIVILNFTNHPERFGYQKIQVEQTIEETINDTSSSN